MDVPAKVDLGTALSSLTSDPAWFKKYALAGLFLLIPIVGPIAVMGWQRRIFEATRQGDLETLPDPRFGEDIGHGVPVFVATLNLLVPMMLLFVVIMVVGSVFAMIGLGIAAAIDNQELGQTINGLASIAIWLTAMAGMFFAFLLVPEMQRRGFRGEMTPLLSPGQSFAAIKADPGAYGMVILGTIIAQFISGLGTFACYVGVFFTLAISMVIIARLVAQWDTVVEERLRG